MTKKPIEDLLPLAQVQVNVPAPPANSPRRKSFIATTSASSTVDFLPCQRHQLPLPIPPIPPFVSPRDFAKIIWVSALYSTSFAPRIIASTQPLAAPTRAWVMLRYNGRARAVYLRLTHGGKARKKQAIVAVACKLLVRCWAILRDPAPWRDPAPVAAAVP